MRLDDLFEKRSHENLNPKRSPLEELERLAGKGLFVTFTEDFGINRTKQRSPRGPKLGINPRSEFKTPVGIYAYPVEEVIDHTHATLERAPDIVSDNGGLTAAFTGNRAWKKAIVFGVQSENVLQEPFPRSSYFEACDKLVEIFGDEVRDIIARGEEEANDPDSRISRLWNITRLLATNHRWLNRAKAINYPKASTRWNWILRKLGFDAAFDLDGEGFIHENEPTQIVVFNPRVIKPVEVIARKDYSKMNQRLVAMTAYEGVPKLISTIMRMPDQVVRRLDKWAVKSVTDILSTRASYEVAKPVFDKIFANSQPRFYEAGLRNKINDASNEGDRANAFEIYQNCVPVKAQLALSPAMYLTLLKYPGMVFNKNTVQALLRGLTNVSATPLAQQSYLRVFAYLLAHPENFVDPVWLKQLVETGFTEEQKELVARLVENSNEL